MDGSNVISLPQFVSLGNEVKKYEVYENHNGKGKITIKPTVSIRYLLVTESACKVAKFLQVRILAKIPYSHSKH